MTDALVSGLNFSRGKGDSEVAWIDAMITARDQVCRDAIADIESEDAVMNDSDKILTLEPLPLNEVSDTGFVMSAIRKIICFNLFNK